MPGNLEAPRILPERAYGIKKKSAENPYPTTVLDRRPQRRVGPPTSTKPVSRAPQAAKRTLDAGGCNAASQPIMKPDHGRRQGSYMRRLPQPEEGAGSGQRSCVRRTAAEG
jgi:hypothetical protein